MGDIQNLTIRLDACYPHPRNYNQHPAAQVERLAQSLHLFGQVRSIVVQEAVEGSGRYVIVAGEGVWQGAKKAGMVELKADVIPSTWPEHMVLAYLAADNELSRSSDPDREQLALLVAEVNAQDHAAAILAAGDEENLADMVLMASGDKQSALDEAVSNINGACSDAQERWGVNVGDIWRAGDQVMVCGDSHDPQLWRAGLDVLGKTELAMAFTSPPYAEQRKESYGGVPEEQYVEWFDGVQAAVRGVLAQDGSFFINIKPHCSRGERTLYVLDLVLAMKRAWGWRFVDELIWQKPGLPGKLEGRLKNCFEPVYWFSAGEHVSVYLAGVADGEEYDFNLESIFLQEAGSTFHFSVDERIKFHPRAGGWVSERVRKYNPLGKSWNPKTGNVQATGRMVHGVALPGNVLKLQVNQEALAHSAVFPVALPAFYVRVFSEEGDVVGDPFCGSGTSLLAAQQLGRMGVGIEILPQHVAVALDRFESLGIKGERIGGG